MKKRVLTVLGGLILAAVGFVAVLYLVAWVVRPDVKTPPAPPSPAALAAVETARRGAETLDLKSAPRIVRDVDYTQGNAAPWWPKGESPALAALVQEGNLPPVAQRVGPEPVVLAGVDGVGTYGGTWMRLVNSVTDLSTIYWRLSDANLVRWSPQGYPIVPHLAKSWEVSADRRVYTFTLRAGVKWSDGAPFTSDDLVYWYEHEVRYFNVQPKFLRAGSTLGRVVKVDDLHVRFEFDQPNPLFLERLATTSQNYEDFTEHIVPAHYLRQYHPTLGDPQLIRQTMDALKLSSAVAVYKSKIKHFLNPAHPRLWPWVIRTSPSTAPYTFVRNPYYWAVDEQGDQLPYLDRLVMDIKNNNLIAIAAANGEPSMQDRHIRYEDYTLLLGNAAASGYEVYHWKPSTQSLFALFPNLNRAIDPARPDTRWRHDLLNDRRFRQALSLAIDRQQIIAADFNGQGEPAQIAPPPDSPYYNARLRHAFTDFDPARANALLDELGLRTRDAEGFRTLPGGERLSFTLNATEFTPEGPAQFVIHDWARVGIRAVLRLRARRLFEQEKRTFEHDFTVWTGESEFYPLVEPRNFVPTYFEAFYAPGFGAWYQSGGLYGDPAANRPTTIAPPAGHPLRRAMELLNSANALPTEAERIARFNEIQNIAADELWTISIASRRPARPSRVRRAGSDA